MIDAKAVSTPKPRLAFGRWLLSQTHRADAIGELANKAKLDPGFPRDGTPDQVSVRLNQVGADGEMHSALEDAELDWFCL